MKCDRHNTPVRRQQKISPALSRQIIRHLLTWFSKNARDLPWRRTRDPYAIWVSEIMLQQTQVATVIPYWIRWMTALPTLANLADAPQDRVLKLWEGLGYYNRARNLQGAAKMIVNEYNARFPESFAALLELPGIGRYTAGAICSIAYDQPTPVLDGNVVRILTRIFGIGGNPKEKVTNTQLWSLSEGLVQTAARIRLSCSHLNQSLMELGALICTPHHPSCDVCPVRRHCVAKRDDRTGELPNLGPRTKSTARNFFALIIERNGQFLVRQREAGDVNAGLWEFPNAELTRATLTNSRSIRAVAKSQFHIAITKPNPMFQIRRSVTRYRDTIEVFRASITSKKALREKPWRWLNLDELNAIALSGAHRKILKRLVDGANAAHCF